MTQSHDKCTQHSTAHEVFALKIVDDKNSTHHETVVWMQCVRVCVKLCSVCFKQVHRRKMRLQYIILIRSGKKNGLCHPVPHLFCVVHICLLLLFLKFWLLFNFCDIYINICISHGLRFAYDGVTSFHRCE